MPEGAEETPNGEAKEMPSASLTGQRQQVFSLNSICQVIIAISKQLWNVCPVMILILLLVYWEYGSLLALCLLLLSVIGLAYNAQDMLLYYPEQPPTSRLYVEPPSAFKLPYENLYVQTKDRVKINLVFIRQPTGIANVAPTIVFLHGNAGNIGHRLANMFGLFTTTGCNLLLVEYRGFGKSDGSPSEQGLYNDSQAAIDFLLRRDDVNHQKIFVFGRSLGGAVAIHLASQARYANVICGLILENTFTSLPEIGKVIFNVKPMKYIPQWCYKNQYPSKKLLQTVQIPTLFLSGQADTLIPPRMMQDLYNNSGSAMKRLTRFESGTHNETWQCSGYYESIGRFISQVFHSTTATRKNGALDNPGVQEI